MIFTSRVCVSKNLPMLISYVRISATSRRNHGYLAEISPISTITVISVRFQ